jgi:hypothetical protein
VDGGRRFTVRACARPLEVTYIAAELLPGLSADWRTGLKLQFCC